MKTSITGKDLFKMVNSDSRISRRWERQKKHALIIQDLSSLMGFLGKEGHKYPSSPTRINAVSIWSEIERDMSSPLHTHKIKRRSGIFSYISIDLPWNTWNNMYRVFRKTLRQISMLFRTWHSHECTRGLLCQIFFFIRYWHWCRWQQPDLKSMSPPWLLFSLILNRSELSTRATIVSTALALEINLLWVNNVAVFSQRFLSK